MRIVGGSVQVSERHMPNLRIVPPNPACMIASIARKPGFVGIILVTIIRCMSLLTRVSMVVTSGAWRVCDEAIA